ncbi:MAG: hypothetical protein NC240_03655 [Clostridium sp.]|nr:hypothetical protein [Clostridium sp.]
MESKAIRAIRYLSLVSSIASIFMAYVGACIVNNFFLTFLYKYFTASALGIFRTLIMLIFILQAILGFILLHKNKLLLRSHGQSQAPQAINPYRFLKADNIIKACTSGVLLILAGLILCTGIIFSLDVILLLLPIAVMLILSISSLTIMKRSRTENFGNTAENNIISIRWLSLVSTIISLALTILYLYLAISCFISGNFWVYFLLGLFSFCVFVIFCAQTILSFSFFNKNKLLLRSHSQIQAPQDINPYRFLKADNILKTVISIIFFIFYFIVLFMLLRFTAGGLMLVLFPHVIILSLSIKCLSMMKPAA